MSDCVFCKIVAGKIPSTKIYEDDEFLAFLDIHPVSQGHALVIPKKHYDGLIAMSPETAGRFFQIVQKIAPAITKGANAEGFNLGLNNGESAGQVIFHAHMHIMPRNKDDGLKLWGQREYKKGEMEQVAIKIKQLLNI